MPLSTNQSANLKDSYASQDAGFSMFWLSQNQNGRLFLLGCPLELTPREYGILMSVIRRYPGAALIEDICKDNKGLGPCSVPVHITAINKKAARIGGRKLIIARRGSGYILNRFM